MANNQNRNRNNRNNNRQRNRDKEAFEMVQNALEESQSNQQPFMWQGRDGRPEVVGDTTDIDNANDYVVSFMYPKQFAGNFEDAEELENGNVLVKRSFEDVQLTPQKARRIKNAASVIITQFLSYDQSTGLRYQTVAEMAEVYAQLTPELWDAMEAIVQGVLGITDFDMEYTTDESVLEVAVKIVTNNSGFFQ